MDQNECGQMKHGVEKSNIPFPSPQKLGIVGNQNWETKFVSHTPEKTNKLLNTNFEEGEIKILQRHKTIVQLFDGMSCSLRLLGLRKKSPTFQNICTQVEVLARRKLSFRDLAQMKYLLSDAIQIDKILVHDKKTLCMKPDMEIVLLFNVVEGHHEQSDFIALHQLFASRLIDYFTAHPEAREIPEAVLPDPFNQRKENTIGDNVTDIPEAVYPEFFNQMRQTIASQQMLEKASIEDLPTITESELQSKLSHMHPSFSRHFSNKVIMEKMRTQPPSSVPLSPVASNDSKSCDIVILKNSKFPDLSCESDSGTNLDTQYEQVKESCGANSKSSSMHSMLIKPINSQSSNASAYASPLWKPVSSAANLMVETPAQSTPRRAMPSSDDKHKGIASEKQPSSCKAAKRSLNFSSLEGDEPECCELSETLDGSSAQFQKVEKGLHCAEEQYKMNQSDSLHQQISSNLSGLVSLIHCIFQSVNYSPITKEELVHKIIINTFDFVERKEVEEQIETLEKLVPDWICMKLAACGDVLCSIKKISDLRSVQSRVETI